MNILAVDTTTKVASVAIKKENEDIVMKNISNEITHSEKLLPLIDETLKELSMTLKDISLYIAVNGPGSFTGIRIGLSTLKAFSMIDGNKIFSITSDKLIAYDAYTNYKNLLNKEKNNIPNKIYVASLIDAKNDRVYYSLSEILTNSKGSITINSKVETSNNVSSSAFSEILNYLKRESSQTCSVVPVIFSGDCINLYTNVITDISNSNKNDIDVVYTLNNYPTTSSAINAYFDIEDKSNYLFDTYTLDAIYARKSQAERIKYEK